jgi:ABC-type glycerol-3-phosphate transport system substrate-binding protein
MKRGISLLLCLLLVLGISAFTTASAEDRVTLVYQTWNPGEDWFAAVEEDFEAKFPNIDVQHVFVPYSDHIQKLKIDLATGQGPDVFSLQTGATLKEFRDFEVKMNDLAAAEWGENWEDTIVSFAREVTPENGEYYGLPMGTSYAGTIWADLTYFDKYELEVPTNLDELKEVCAKLRENGEMPLVIGAKDDWINLDMWMNIANDVSSEKLYAAIAGEVPFTDADLVKSFEIWKDLFDSGVFQDGALGVNVYNDTSDLFDIEGSIPLICNGSWVINCYPERETNPEMFANWNGEGRKHTVINMDWTNDGKPAPIQATVENVLCMNNATEHPDEAWAFIKYMLYDGQDLLNNRYLAYFPSRTGVEFEGDLSPEGIENFNKLMEMGATNTGGYRENPYPELKQSIADNLKALALGEVTPEQAGEIIEAVSKTTER